MTVHLAVVENTPMMAIFFMSPEPRSMLLNMGVRPRMKESMTANLTRSNLFVEPKRAFDTSPEKTKSTKHGSKVTGTLKMAAARMCAEASLPFPLSSEINLGSDEASPKSDSTWTKELTSVMAVSIPICSWVIALAR